MMSVDQRDAWVRAYLEDVFNGHNLQSLDKYMTENIVSHWLGDGSLHGREAWKEAMANFFDAFPDAAYALNDLFFAGDKGVWRGTWRATQRKEWCFFLDPRRNDAGANLSPEAVRLPACSPYQVATV